MILPGLLFIVNSMTLPAVRLHNFELVSIKKTVVRGRV